MKIQVMNFLGQLFTVNPIPPQPENDEPANEPAIYHIASGQTFSLFTGQAGIDEDEMPSFIVTTRSRYWHSSTSERILLPAYKVITFLLLDYAKACSITEGNDERTEYLHIKEHLFHKTGFEL
jgi:hypothetical protein